MVRTINHIIIYEPWDLPSTYCFFDDLPFFTFLLLTTSCFPSTSPPPPSSPFRSRISSACFWAVDMAARTSLLLPTPPSLGVSSSSSEVEEDRAVSSAGLGVEVTTTARFRSVSFGGEGGMSADGTCRGWGWPYLRRRCSVRWKGGSYEGGSD